MNLAERISVKHYLTDYPHDWSFKQIVDHLYYEYDERPEVTPRPIYDGVLGDELGALLNRFYMLMANKAAEK